MKTQISLFVLLSIFGFSVVGCGSTQSASVLTESPLPEQPATKSVVVETEAPKAILTEEPKSMNIRIGVNNNSIHPLINIENETYSGFEIDIATEIVSRVYDNGATIEWIQIPGPERFSSLAEGQIDMLVRSALHTVSREDQALFSGGYLLAGNGFLVFPERGFSSIADLDGKDITFVSYLEEELNSAAGKLGVTFNPVPAENLDEARGNLGFERADALFHDWVALSNEMDMNVHALLIDDSLLGPLGVAFPLDATELRDEVNRALEDMIADGTWQNIYDKWFTVDVAWDIEEMLSFPPADR